jgi:4-hydroxyphenylpyruvate dioxygenase
MTAEPEPSNPANPLGLDGIEFIEYATGRPDALGAVLELMGFQLVARHRSREVLLYRQGAMNVVVNAHDGGRRPHGTGVDDEARVSAIALRAVDAASAYRRALEHGAWAVPTRVEVMELNIPAVHGAGASRIYFVDRYREFSIYTVDFVPIPSVEQEPPAVAGMRWSGLVQGVGPGRTSVWTEFYGELFAFTPFAADQPEVAHSTGRVLRSPCGRFFLELVESEPGPTDGEVDEGLVRVVLATADVAEAARVLRGRGVDLADAGATSRPGRGALTQRWLGGVMFELVRDERVGQELP